MKKVCYYGNGNGLQTQQRKTNDKSDDPVFPPLGHNPVYEHRGTHDEIERRKFGAMTPVERGRILMF